MALLESQVPQVRPARNKQASLPVVWPRMFRWFAGYSERYLRKHFHAVRILKDAPPPENVAGPLIVYLNHPAWWDPLVGIVLANRFFGERTHYAPIESAALARYKFFERLGFFGISPHERSGAARFLEMGSSVLASDNAALWITAQGRLVDVRERPVTLRSGTAHLAAGASRGYIVPLAVEYPFWEERTPEALVAFGEPLPLDDGFRRDVAQWREVLATRLEATQEMLAHASLRRDGDDWHTLLRGKAGVGGIYDRWRMFRAKLRGEKFSPEHGSH